MRSTALAILTLAGGLLLVAVPALAADDTERRTTPAFETPGAGPAPETPTGHDPGPTPDPVMQTDPAMKPDPAMNDDPAMKHEPTKTMKPAPSPSAAAGSHEYVVEAGDTLGEIAKRELGSAARWPEIARANGIEKPEMLRAGQKIQIPRATSEEHSKL